MSGWTAIVPFNFGRPRKTRLATILSEAERDALARAMAEHVVSALTTAPSVTAILLLSPVNPGLAGTIWTQDRGRGLNVELEAGRAALDGAPALLIHADLPLLSAEDVEALLAAAGRDGTAIAPDAAGLGTNALALGEGRMAALAFGAASLARHRERLPQAVMVTRPGLAQDVDDETSLRQALKHGFMPPFALPGAGW